jgi:type II secretory pathway component GspD/PulD (secretin)
MPRGQHQPSTDALQPASPRTLLSRAGAVSAGAFLAAALFTVPPTGAQEPAKSDAPAQTDPAQTEEMKRFLEEAKKAGVNLDKAKQLAPIVGDKKTNPQPISRVDTARPSGTQQTLPGLEPTPPVEAPKPTEEKPKPAPGATPLPTPGAQPAAPAPGTSVPGMTPSTPQPAHATHPVRTTPHLPADPNEPFTFNFAEPVELLTLVNFVRDELGLQIVVQDAGLVGQKVTLTSPVTVRQDQVLPFIVTLLEEKEYTMTEDFPTVYVVKPKNGITPAIGSTTKIFRTPNIKPSSLQQAIAAILNVNRGGTPATQPVFLDDLGIIILTDTPRMLRLVQDLIDGLVKERTDIRYWRFDLAYISAASGRDRVLELLGQQTQRIGAGGQGQPGAAGPIPGGPIPGGLAGNLTNIGDRMTIDPNSNALIFRGREDEKRLLGELLTLVDAPNNMISEWYPVGQQTAEAVANAGKNEQLGTIATFESSAGRSGGGRGGITGAIQNAVPGLASSASNEITGSGFVLYTEAGGFIYRGTRAQHERVKALVTALKDLSAQDTPILEFYKLKHGKSEDVAEVIQNLLTNSQPTGNRSGGGLLGRDNNSRSRTQPQGRQNPLNPANQPQAAASANADGALGDFAGEDVYVIADQPNNQIIVKAPRKLQPQFRQLINRIDLRRPQVYLDAKIVVVSNTDNFDLSVETQQIIGQFAFNTNFGLGSLVSGTGPTATGGIQSRKTVSTGLDGITAALIRSKDVPFVVNALARKTDARIVATPQLLVDDNEEAEISSLDQQPTTTTSQTTGNPQTTSFGGFESAGPKLKIKPQISEGGYLRLEYEIELSSFQGSSTGGVPPPKQENKIRSDSVTVPGDATIVVGGLTFDQVANTVLKIPLLGDIPLIGVLFKDQSQTKRKNTLYVFITPRIMKDPTGADLRMLTQGPLIAADLPAEFPPAKTVSIPVVDTKEYADRERERLEAEKNKTKEPQSPAKGDEKPKVTPVRRRSWDRPSDPG